MAFDMGDYKEVSERIQDFRAKHPDGTLQAEVVPSPFDGFIVVKGYAYRTPDDERPGVGWAWEPVPGKTPYTKDSELQNAETSAWGRAIIAAGASDAKKVASADEVRNREPAKPALTDMQQSAKDAVGSLDDEAKASLKKVWEASDVPLQFSVLSDGQAAQVLKWVDETESVPF